MELIFLLYVSCLFVLQSFFSSFVCYATARPVSHAAVPPAAVPGGAAGAAANPAAAAFAINPQEHTKYHTLFVSYDKDQDG
jgi:hypothetical protein